MCIYIYICIHNESISSTYVYKWQASPADGAVRRAPRGGPAFRKGGCSVLNLNFQNLTCIDYCNLDLIPETSPLQCRRGGSVVILIWISRCTRLRLDFEFPESDRHRLCKPGGIKSSPNLTPSWFSGTHNPPTNIIPTKIAWLRLSGKDDYAWVKTSEIHNVRREIGRNALPASGGGPRRRRARRRGAHEVPARPASQEGPNNDNNVINIPIIDNYYYYYWLFLCPYFGGAKKRELAIITNSYYY